MKKKNLRKTEGLPFNLGMAAGVALVLQAILSFNLSEIQTQATLTAMGLPDTTAGVSNPLWSIISFLVNPGIFLLLLFLGKNKEKRGSAFAVVWIVIPAISLISTIASIFAMKNVTLQVAAAVDLVMPGGYWIENGLALLGWGLMIASCIVLWKRLHQPPVLETPEVYSVGNNPTNGQQ
ncbi:MAG: FtsK-4TM domain-containing protein [Oscillospiraceae bacterium]|jgi:lysylphosphatidylglycerol synthetase-like protein (DUF2156 family)